MDAGNIINAAGGLLFTALGVTILVGAPRTRTNVLFASFLVAFGSPFILGNLVEPALVGDAYNVLAWVMAASWLTAGILLMAFWLQPEASGAPRTWRRFSLPTLIASAYVAITYGTFFPTGFPFYQSSFFLWAAAFWFGLIFLALTFSHLVRLGRHQEASRCMVLSLGLAVFPSFAPGTTLHDGFYLGLKATNLGFGPLFWLDLLLVVIVSMLWIRNSAVVEKSWGRPSRALGLTILGLGLGGMLLGVSSLDPNSLGTQGISRAMGVFILVYGVLRHQLLEMDVKLRWGLSRSTIAAAFVATFFVASEGAQILFGQGNEWVGLTAAGALVFAIAPLQRVAERFAERAVPVGATGESELHPHARAYRLAVLTAVNDGRLTPAEEGHLADLAEELGIGAGEALRLRREVEREVEL